MTHWLGAMSIAAILAFAGTSLAESPAFDEVDVNHDGRLTMSEAAVVAALDFGKADTNRDGVLSRSEYEAAVG